MTEKMEGMENINEEPIQVMDEAEYNRLLAEQKAEHMKALRRHKFPAVLTLDAALNALTKTELEDIQYNLNLEMASNINRVKKAEMVAAVKPEVISFSQRWFVSCLEEQKAVFDFLLEHEGWSTELQLDDYKLDYLRGIGVLYCGLTDGKLAWYMPKEIQEEYKKINNGAFQDIVHLNTEIMRIAAGLVFYYGVMDYDQLFTAVKEHVDGDYEFADFIGVMFNGGCWFDHVAAGAHELMRSELINAEALQAELQKRTSIEYAKFPYDKLWDAGDPIYIESTAAYRALAQMFMNKKGLDVLQAAEAVRNLTTIIQNGYGMREITSFLEDENLHMDSEDGNKELYDLIARYNNTLPMWVLKGHSPDGLSSIPVKPVVRTGKKIGRNDPCPCGSGKKFKNCCIDKIF